MATIEEWRAVGDRLRNWGRWGGDDELGTLNFITADKIKQAAGLVKQGKVFPLGVNFDAYGPQGAHGFRRNPIHLMTVDGGDSELAAYLSGWGGESEELLHMFWSSNLMRFNDDFIIMPLQAATQWDALSHVYYDGLMYNNVPAAAVTSFGATKNSIDKVDVKGIVSKGVLLDIAHHRGVPYLPANTPVTSADLDEVERAQGVRVEEGDIVCVRTGWWAKFLEDRADASWAAGSPGVTWDVAQWLHSRSAAAIASDNVAVEVGGVQIEGVALPMHLHCIRDMGMMLGEMWDFEALSRDCAEDGVYEFQLAAPPLRVTGAVGSPINPLAMK